MIFENNEWMRLIDRRQNPARITKLENIEKENVVDECNRDLVEVALWWMKSGAYQESIE